MAIDDINNDDLTLDLNVGNQEKWAADLAKARGYATETADAMTDAFTQGEVRADRFGQSMLTLQRRVQSLSQDFQKTSTKDFGQDLEYVNVRARENVTRLAELQRELRAVDELIVGHDLSKNQFDRMTEGIRTNIAMLERELILLRQLETLQAQSNDPRQRAPISEVDTEARKLLQLQSNLRSLETGFARIRDINVGRGVNDLSTKSLQAIERIGELRNKVISLDRALVGETRKSVIEDIITDARRAEIEIQQLKRQLLTLQIESPAAAQGGGGAGLLGGIGRGLGLPYFGGAGLGAAAAIGTAYVGIERFITYSEKALERNKELLQSQRQLNASASELGVSYSYLSDKNRQYAEAAGLSIVKTAELTSKVAQLAARTAQPERLDKLTRGLLDLGAARGLDQNELLTVTNQIITGQDEAYKKLGIKNPQLLYKEYAQQQSRSVDSLSQLERQRIYQDEILKKAELFSGAAKTRLESVDGQVAKTSAAWENMLNNLSQSYSSSRGVFEFLDAANAGLKQLGITADQTREKLSQGISPAKLAAEQSQPGIFAALKLLAEGFLAPYTIAGQSLGEAAIRSNTLNQVKPPPQKGFGSIAGLYDELSGQNQALYQDEVQRRINATLNEQSIQKKVAEESRKRLEEANKEEDIRREAAVADKSFQNVLKRKANDVDAINRAYNELLEKAKLDITGVYFNQDKLESEAFKYAEAVSNAIAKSYETILKNPKSNLKDLQRGLLGVGGETKLTDEDKERLTYQFESTIKSSVEKIQSLTKQVRDTTVSIEGKNNPFVKIFSDMETATDRAQERFGLFGKDFVNKMAEMERAQLRVELGQARFLNNLKTLDFQQQAFNLKNQSYQQRDGFQRNLAFASANVDYVSSRVDIQRQLAEAKFFANEFNLYNPKSFNEARFGSSYGDHLNPEIKDALEAITKLSRIDTQGTGVLGQGVIADAILKRIPTTDQLVAELYQGGERREDAEKLLDLRAKTLQQKQAGEDEKFAELIRNQVFAEQARKFAQQKIDLLNDSGLNQSDKAFAAQQALNITGELGPGELTSSLRNSRLQALNVLAEDAKNKEKEATERMKTIVDTLKVIGDALTKSGVKIDTSTTPLLDVQISNTSNNATTNTRPNSSDVQRRNND